MKKRQFEKMIFKNIFINCAPALAVFFLLLWILSHYPLLKNAKCYEMSDDGNFELALMHQYESGQTNVHFTDDSVMPMGFDYLLDGKKKGSYYYSIKEDKLYIYLLKNKGEASDIKGTIICDELRTEYILNQFAKETAFSIEDLQDFSSAFIISEIDYPYVTNAIIYGIFIVPIILSMCIICYMILVLANPGISTLCKQLKTYGEVDEIIKELNLELYKNVKYKSGNVYVTRDYLIVNRLIRTDVVGLDHVVYMSKNIVEVGNIKPREMYRLTLSNPDKLFYEIDFVDEETIDDVVTAIRGKKVLS